MLERSYKKIGGFKSAADPEELVLTPGYWKLVRRDGKITAVNIYKRSEKTKNYKSIASATETELDPVTGNYRATPRGLKDYNMLKNEDLKMKRSWSEVSGAAEVLLKRAAAIPVSNKFAEVLTGKRVLSLDDDGFHYTRLIQGEPHTKIIYGFVDLTQDAYQELTDRGIDLAELPPNIAASIA
jgi:hypothetical protein